MTRQREAVAACRPSRRPARSSGVRSSRLRIGVVPKRGLELFATGLDRFEDAIDEEIEAVADGRGRFKAVRGDDGAGKTFFSCRWRRPGHRCRRVHAGDALRQHVVVDLVDGHGGDAPRQLCQARAPVRLPGHQVPVITATG